MSCNINNVEYTPLEQTSTCYMHNISYNYLTAMRYKRVYDSENNKYKYYFYFAVGNYGAAVIDKIILNDQALGIPKDSIQLINSSITSNQFSTLTPIPSYAYGRQTTVVRQLFGFGDEDWSTTRYKIILSGGIDGAILLVFTHSGGIMMTPVICWDYAAKVLTYQNQSNAITIESFYKDPNSQDRILAVRFNTRYIRLIDYASYQGIYIKDIQKEAITS